MRTIIMIIVIFARLLHCSGGGDEDGRERARRAAQYREMHADTPANALTSHHTLKIVHTQFRVRALTLIIIL